MQNVFLSLVLNGTMAGLLLATIVYCLKLNARIRVLQDSKSDLARIIREFDESTQRATQSIAEIHQATARLSDNIQHKIDKANFLMTDLDFLIERGGKITGKTEHASPRPSAPMSRPEPSAAPRNPAPAANAPRAVMEDVPATAEATAGAAAPRRGLRMRSRAEQELMSMLGNKTGESGR